MDKITLDPNIAGRLNDGMKSGGAVELPFPVIYLWVLNGQNGYKASSAQAPAPYYGGWACKADDLDGLLASTGLALPQGWKPCDISARDGGEFAAYTTRQVICAPLSTRVSWMSSDGRRSPNYQEGWRRHVQALAYLADQITEGDKRRIMPWGPVVLTAKGYQARNLVEAFAKWQKATNGLRLKVAPGVPAWCFYLTLGTFGKERQVVNVGKPGAQSPITPISVYVPEGMDEANFAARYVGAEIAGQMVEYLDQAREWLAAWKTPQAEDGAIADDVYPMMDGGIPDEIPF